MASWLDELDKGGSWLSRLDTQLAGTTGAGQVPASFWERERGGIARLFGGLIRAPVTLGRIVLPLVAPAGIPSQQRLEAGKQLVGVGKEVGKSLGRTVALVRDVPEAAGRALVPGGKSLVESALGRRVGETSLTETLAEHLGNVALAGGLVAKGARAAGAAGTAGRIEAATHPVRALTSTLGARGRAALEASATGAPLTTTQRLLRPVGSFAESTRVRAENLIPALSQIRGAQVAAAREPAVLATTTAEEQLLRLRPDLTPDQARQLVGREITEQLGGTRAFEADIRARAGLLPTPPTLPPELTAPVARAVSLTPQLSRRLAEEFEVAEQPLTIPARAGRFVEASARARTRAAQLEAQAAAAEGRIPEPVSRLASARGQIGEGPISLESLQTTLEEARRAPLTQIPLGYQAGRRAGLAERDLATQIKATSGLHEQAARSWAQGIRHAQRAVEIATNVRKGSLGRFPSRWQPLVQSVRRTFAELDAEVAAGRMLSSEADLIRAGIPDHLPDLMRRAAELDMDPVHFSTLTPAKVQQLALGQPFLGDPFRGLKEITAGTRKRRTGALLQRDEFERGSRALRAAYVDLYHERINNRVLDSIESEVVRPIPEIDGIRQVPEGWVPWNRSSFERIERVTPEGAAIPTPAARTMVPDSIDRTLRAFSAQGLPQRVPAIGRLVTFSGKVLNPWRHLLLTLSPRFYANNLVGNAILGSLEMGVGPKAFRAWQEAYRSLKKETVEGQVVRGRRLPPELFGASLRQEMQGGRLTQAIRDFSRRHTGRDLSLEAVGRLNSYIDELARAAVYIHARRRGVSDAQAISTSLRALVNYSDLSPFERSVIRQIFPFYAFQKGMLKRAVRLPLDHPLRTAALSKVSLLLGGYTEEERRQYPDYLFAGIPLGRGQVSTRGINPFQDSLALATPEGIIGSLSPLVEVPIRAGFDVPEKGFEYGRPLKVDPYGFLQPDVTLREGIATTVRDLPPARLIPGLQPESPYQTPIGLRALQQLGITYRTPEQIRRAVERAGKGRKAASRTR